MALTEAQRKERLAYLLEEGLSQEDAERRLSLLESCATVVTSPKPPVQNALDLEKSKRDSEDIMNTSGWVGTEREGYYENGKIVAKVSETPTAIYRAQKQELADYDARIKQLRTMTSEDALAVNNVTVKLATEIKNGTLTTQEQIAARANELSKDYTNASNIAQSSIGKLDMSKVPEDQKEVFLNTTISMNSSQLEEQFKNRASLERLQKERSELEKITIEKEAEYGGGNIDPREFGPPYFKLVKSTDPDTVKAACADVSNTYEEGYVGAGNGRFLDYYLKNPSLYTNVNGRALIDSDNGYKALSNLEPKDQKLAVDSISSVLSDSEKSYKIDPSNPQIKNPGVDKILTLEKNGKKEQIGIDPTKCSLSETDGLGLLEKQGMIKTSEGPSSNENGQNGADVKPADQEKPEDIVPDDYTKSDKFLTIANHNDIPYYRVNGYNKIRFPNIWDAGPYHIDLMGLPPMRIQKDPLLPSPIISANAFDMVTVAPTETVPEMLMYNEDEQLKKSFLKLTIHPIDVEFLNGVNGKVTTDEQKKKLKEKYSHRSMVIEEIEYNFAVQSKNNITFNHSNQYQSSGVESMLGNAFSSIGNTISEFSALSNVSGGVDSIFNSLGSLGNRAGSIAKQGLKESMESLRETITSSFEDAQERQSADNILNTLGKFGNLAAEKLSGGRVDLPDIWTSSQTNISHQFTIELMTLNPDPLSVQYCKDILIPLYILLTLAMPADADGIIYKTPPYIYCSLDEFVKIKLGAITNINIDTHVDRVNFKRAPTHVTVQLTIRDLYSVMKQTTYDKSNNKIGEKNDDTTDKDEFIYNFVKYAEKYHSNKEPTTNEPYYLTEFGRIPAYLMALEDYKKEQQKKLTEKLNKASVNAQKGSKLGLKGVSADVSKVAKAVQAGADKVNRVKDGNFITSIGNAITSITKGVTNIIAGTQKAIPHVRNLINTGKMVLNSANGLRSSIKLIGQTANLDGILNGQFASSVGFAFSNIANATEVVENISNGCLGGGSSNTIVNAVGQVPQSILSTDVANCITDTGSVNLSNQIRNSACSMYALANMFGSTYANVVGLKNLGSNGGDILDKAQSLFDNLGGIANGINSFATGQNVGNTSNVVTVDPLMQRYVSNLTTGMVGTGAITAGEASSNTKLQNELQEVAGIAVNQLSAPMEVSKPIVDPSTGESIDYIPSRLQSANSSDSSSTSSSSANTTFQNPNTAYSYWKSQGKSDEMAKALSVLEPEEQESVKRSQDTYKAYLEKFNGDEKKAKEVTKALIDAGALEL